MPCSQPHGEARYDESNGTNVPSSNATAIVTVWYAGTGVADAANDRAAVGSGIPCDLARLRRTLVADVARLRTGERGRPARAERPAAPRHATEVLTPLGAVDVPVELVDAGVGEEAGDVLERVGEDVGLRAAHEVVGARGHGVHAVLRLGLGLARVALAVGDRDELRVAAERPRYESGMMRRMPRFWSYSGNSATKRSSTSSVLVPSSAVPIVYSTSRLSNEKSSTSVETDAERSAVASPAVQAASSEIGSPTASSATTRTRHSFVPMRFRLRAGRVAYSCRYDRPSARDRCLGEPLPRAARSLRRDQLRLRRDDADPGRVRRAAHRHPRRGHDRASARRDRQHAHQPAERVAPRRPHGGARAHLEVPRSRRRTRRARAGDGGRRGRRSARSPRPTVARSPSACRCWTTTSSRSCAISPPSCARARRAASSPDPARGRHGVRRRSVAAATTSEPTANAVTISSGRQRSQSSSPAVTALTASIA